MYRSLRFLAVCVLLLSLARGQGLCAQGGENAAAGAPLKYRWVWVMTNLQVDEQVARLQSLMKRASAAGYNGIVLSDYKLNVLDRVPPFYFKNVQAVKQTADQLGLEIIPTVCPIGYSNGLLAHDPNLAEGLPVKDALFVVNTQTADISAEPDCSLKNGDFEASQNDRFTGWFYQDRPGVCTFADTAVHHGGLRSIRMENIGGQNARVYQEAPVAPFCQYHLSVWVKTQDFETPGNVRAAVLAKDAGSANSRSLLFSDWKIRRTQDWTRYDAVFNSLDHQKVSVYLGVWGGKSGAIWWDDARLEEVGLLNVLRRPGCPLVVRGEDGTLYREGVDFDPVKDPKMGTVPWAGDYEVYHTPPVLHIPAGSRIRDGQRLRVSFYHAVTIGDDQAACCLSEPAVYDILRDQVKGTNDLLHPTGFFMSHDEVRVANWCEACQKRAMTPGQLLADNVSRCATIIRNISPGARLFVWSDMFDPYHNAHDNYYLVNGTWDGSWDGLPKDAVIVNWNYGSRSKSVPWFSGRGFSQVLAGYYDGDPQRIRTWLDDEKAQPGIVGVMYTTWQNRYDDLEAFARAAWGPAG